MNVELRKVTIEHLTLSFRFNLETYGERAHISLRADCQIQSYLLS